MAEIIFAKTRYEYPSYTDYWALVSDAGFKICWVDQIDFQSNAIFIVSPVNGEFRPVLDHNASNRKASIITWNLERPNGPGGINEYAESCHKLMDDGYADDVWVSDRELSHLCNLHYVTMGYGNIGIPGRLIDKYYDFAVMACYNYHRSNLFREPGELKTILNGKTLAPNGWGDVRHRYLMQSVCMLNIHQDECKFLEPLRLSLAAAYGLPVVTERVIDPYPYNGHLHQIDVNIHDIRLPNGMSNMYWYERGIQFRHFMHDNFPFRRCVEEACKV